MASENKKYQLSISTMRWFDANGGHLETKGLTSAGEIVEIPLHRHKVNLNIYRIDIGLKYRLGSSWEIETNIPYESKIQEASIEEIEPLTESQKQAAIRNRDIHHRNETYTGPTDMDLLVGYNIQGVLVENDFLMGRIGTTIPIGQTEEDPWILGNAGLEHLHIQFGTGTFNPIGDIHYNIPVFKGIAVTSSLRSKYPLYANKKTYRGSRELTYTGGINFRPNKWFGFHAGYLGFYQSYAYWDGELDINTGLRFSMASFGASISTPYSIPIAIAFMLPLQQETLYDDSNSFVDGKFDESDAFKFGPLISISVFYSF
ncbi:hypothetical protein JT359_17115 [Candidatus Poribacteria bacterium]|nr:hypothetical protein [Candidatus Poribacteria bacterium]